MQWTLPACPRQRIPTLAQMSVSSIVLSYLLDGVHSDTTCHPSASINHDIGVRGGGVIQYDERKQKSSRNTHCGMLTYAARNLSAH